MAALDLVCWDFGDTLVDEMFMSNAPAGVPGWSDAYERALVTRSGFVDDWMLGRAALNELIDPLAAELTMSRLDISRHCERSGRPSSGTPRRVSGSSV